MTITCIVWGAHSRGELCILRRLPMLPTSGAVVHVILLPSLYSLPSILSSWQLQGHIQSAAASTPTSNTLLFSTLHRRLPRLRAASNATRAILSTSLSLYTSVL